ncbi:MAG: GntR family transcriptional regulator [Gammaproteobacteria bacterium]|nr:GntR family transcriptional regulator [Gammaproteobacteria bacterium]MBL6999715.1 GntR family transcriptional regulator [Gammaproteobacteria bacterium]
MDLATPKYILVENYIKEAIRKKTIVEKLPGERTLAKELGFSYMTIRKAIDNLVTEGILYKVPTKGTFVADRNNSRKKTMTIGYFLDNSIEAGVSSPYYSLIFNALEKVAAKNGYALSYFTDLDLASSNNILSRLDGVIASCFPRIENTLQSLKQVLPVVAIDNGSADKTIPSVIIDNFNAVVDSFDHLYALGHRRIGFMTGLEDSDVGKDRCAGYRNGLNKHGLDMDETLVYRGNYSFKSGLKGADYFLSLDKLPSAILCANDSMALGAIRELDNHGIKVPQDISIIGFDDIDVASQVIPALTTIAAPIEDISNHAFDLLLSMIQGETLENKHIALPAKVVVRQSCAYVNKKFAA